MKEQSPTTWRGITFLSRQVQLSNSNKNTNLTGYFITSPFPTDIDWLPSIKFNAKIFIIDLPYGRVFDPAMLLNKDQNKEFLKKELEFERGIYLFVENEDILNISLLGDYPIGCWIPVKNSRFSIKNYRGMYPSSVSYTNFEEEYEYYLGQVEKKESETILKEYMNYPMGDFLGPNIVIWSESKSIIMKCGKDIIDPVPIDYNDISDRDGQIITALLINPPFNAN